MNETNIRETALAMKQSGLSDAGYKYVLLDDCWAEMTRDSAGRLQAQKQTFPASASSQQRTSRAAAAATEWPLTSATLPAALCAAESRLWLITCTRWT